MRTVNVPDFLALLLLCGFLFACPGERWAVSGSGDGAEETPSPGDTPWRSPSSLCRPGALSGEEAVWLEEGESLSVAVGCTGALGLPSSELRVEPLPAGALWDAPAGVLRWTPGLDQAAVYHLRISLPPAHDEPEGRLVIGVADDWDHPSNTPIADPTEYTHELGLPVLFLDALPPDRSWVPANVLYKGRSWAAEGRLRGAASTGYPKKHFTLKFAADDRFSDPEHGFVGKRRLILMSTFDDNSYVRQRLAFDLWNRLDPAHIQVETYSAVLYVGGVYFGLYTIADHVDRHLMDEHWLWEDGNLYKSVNHDANFRNTRADGSPKATFHDGFEKKEGYPIQGEAGAFDDLDDLVDFVANAPDAEFVNEIDTRLRRTDFENWWIFATFIVADDSAGKNVYLYRDPYVGPWRIVPWDFNACLGQDWRSLRQRADLYRNYVNVNRLFERFLEQPVAGPALLQRYGDVLDGAYELSPLLEIYDAYHEEIDRSARRDWLKWEADYRSFWSWGGRTEFTSYEEERDYVRRWIIDRWSYQKGLYP